MSQAAGGGRPYGMMAWTGCLVRASAPVRGFTPERVQSLVGLGLGVASIVLGVLALRSAARGRPIAAIVVGAAGVVLSAVRLAMSGPIGSGSGRLGAIVAVVVGLAGVALGTLALVRARR
jgi:hypothetical protein